MSGAITGDVGDPEKAKALFCALLMQECGGDAEPHWNEYTS